MKPERPYHATLTELRAIDEALAEQEGVQPLNRREARRLTAAAAKGRYVPAPARGRGKK